MFPNAREGKFPRFFGEMAFVNTDLYLRHQLEVCVDGACIIVPLDRHFVVYPRTAGVDEGAGVDQGVVV